MRKVALTVIVVLFSAVNVLAQTATSAPPWTGFVYGHVEFGTARDTDLSRLRGRVSLVPKKDSCKGGRVEVDPVDAGQSYLHQAWLACDVNGWTVKTGRLFSAALTQSPPPFMLKTAKYPDSWTYAAYAYGVQMDRMLGKGWQMSMDFTGKSALKYNDVDHLFDRFETSGRLLRKGGTWSYGGAYQVSRDFLRVGLDGERSLGRLTTNILLAYAKEKDNPALVEAVRRDSQLASLLPPRRKHVEGFVFAEYRLTEWFRPHVQVERAKNKTSVLAGVGIYVKKYVYFVVEHDGHKFLARLQLMVSK